MWNYLYESQLIDNYLSKNYNLNCKDFLENCIKHQFFLVEYFNKDIILIKIKFILFILFILSLYYLQIC